MAMLGGGVVAKNLLEVVAEQKEAQEKELVERAGRKIWDDRDDVPAHLAEGPTQRQFGAHSFVHAEIRVSVFGKATRYISFATAGSNHMFPITCQADEAAIGEWRPRIEALMASFSTPAAKWR